MQFLSDEGPTLETLDFAFYIGMYLNTAYAAHYVYFTNSNTYLV